MPPPRPRERRRRAARPFGARALGLRRPHRRRRLCRDLRLRHRRHRTLSHLRPLSGRRLAQRRASSPLVATSRPAVAAAVLLRARARRSAAVAASGYDRRTLARAPTRYSEAGVLQLVLPPAIGGGAGRGQQQGAGGGGRAHFPASRRLGLGDRLLGIEQLRGSLANSLGGSARSARSPPPRLPPPPRRAAALAVGRRLALGLELALADAEHRVLQPALGPAPPASAAFNCWRGPPLRARPPAPTPAAPRRRGGARLHLGLAASAAAVRPRPFAAIPRRALRSSSCASSVRPRAAARSASWRGARDARELLACSVAARAAPPPNGALASSCPRPSRGAAPRISPARLLGDVARAHALVERGELAAARSPAGAAAARTPACAGRYHKPLADSPAQRVPRGGGGDGGGGTARAGGGRCRDLGLG